MIRCNRICRECMVFGLLYPADDSKWVARRGDNGRVFGGYLHSAPPINNNYNQNGNTANLIFTARECTAAVHACMHANWPMSPLQYPAFASVCVVRGAAARSHRTF